MKPLTSSAPRLSTYFSLTNHPPPTQIQGIIPLGTSLDYESERTRKLGCWDGAAACTGPIDAWTTNDSTPDFEPDDAYCNFLIDIGFGKNCPAETREFWVKTIKGNYRGNEGRRRARMAAINLRERDGLHGRLWDVRCPVMWLHVSLPFSFWGRLWVWWWWWRWWWADDGVGLGGGQGC